MTLFAEVAATSAAVAGTTKRTEKVAAIADLFVRLEAEEVAPVAAWLSGETRQGRIGVGWAAVSQLDVAPAENASLSIAAVDAALAALAATTGSGSVATRHATLTDLFGRATAAEADLLGRLLVGEVRQGALASLVGDGAARAAGVPVGLLRRAAMLNGDLPAAAALARAGGAAALEDVGLTVGRPVQPMLAAPAADVADAIEKTGSASVEWKLDGIRIQAHRSGDEVRLFTRNLNDVTARLPGIVDLVRSFPVTTCVLDGEAMWWADLGEDPAGAGAERPKRFQETASSFGRHDGVAGAALDARFFDILHADGSDLLDATLRERLAVLDRVAGRAAMPRLETSDAAAASAFLDSALEAGHEGVVVKDLDSPYEAGRRGGAWRKVKPVKTLDLVVLAAEWGHGRRTGWLSNLHLGARGPDGGFVMVGKTFKGLSDDLLRWQTEQLLAREVRRTKHAVHVRPELVVEIALDGVQVSTRYPGGVALRFARVRRYRDDKDPSDADAIETLQAMR